MFTQYHDPSPGRTWTLFPHYSVIVLTSISISINIHNIRRRRPLAPMKILVDRRPILMCRDVDKRKCLL